MKRVKKLVAMIMLATMVVPMLTGCGGEKPITLTVYSQLANYSGEQAGWFGKIMLDKFNVKLNIIPDSDGVYDTRMEAGDLGDLVIWGSDGMDYMNAIKAGLLYDWEEDNLLHEYGPYIEENMPYALEKNRTISDGTIYGFGHNVATSSKDHDSFLYSWDLRWDLYQQLGCPEMKNLDDYMNMLIAMKELCPTDENGNETYAFSLWPDWDGTMVMYVKSMVTAYYGYDELGMGNYDPEKGIYYPCLTEDGPYLEMLKFFNQLYRNKLLDPDSMTQTYDEMDEKLKAGGIFASIFNFAGSEGYNNVEEHINDNKIMLSVCPDNACPIVYGQNVMGGNRIWTIGVKTEYPELCMEIINWLATPEGRMVSEYGPQGVIWDYDDNGKTYFTEFGVKVRNDVNLDMSTGSDYSGLYNDGRQQLNNVTWTIDGENPDSNGETYNYRYWESEQAEPKNQAEADWRVWANGANTNEYMENRSNYIVSVGTSYAESEKTDELTLTWEQVIKCIKDYSWKAIYAKTDGEFDHLVQMMISDAKKYGYDDCIAWSENEAAIRRALEVVVLGEQ